MVMLRIDGGGFQTAGTAFVEGTQLGALAHNRLTGVLASCGGMAGDDSTSFEFVGAYDAAAAEAVASLTDLVSAFGQLGRLTHATHANHAAANARAVITGATVYDGGPLPDVGDDAGYVTVLPWTPPSSLGASTPGLSTKIDWILDHIEGFVWPGADLDRLRSATAAWRAAATSLGDLAGCCDSAVHGFWLERSPEIPVAVDATLNLKPQVLDVADSLAALGSACEAYADAVEAKHAEILDLAHWVLEQIVEGVVISVALGVLTGGAGTGVGLSAVAAKVAAQSPRFAAILDALRALAADVAVSVRSARDTLGAARLRLVKFKDAAVARSAAQGERGEMRLWWSRERKKPGWLAAHEDAGGHTMRLHVAVRKEALAARFSERRPPPFASTFRDLSDAERVIGGVLERHAVDIERWLAEGGMRRRLEDQCLGSTGLSMDPAGHVAEVRGVRVILQRDSSMPEGYRILTAFPQP